MPIENKHSACSRIRKSLNLRIYVFLHIVITIFMLLLFWHIDDMNVRG